ncbi:hypothetical protein Cs7R123_39670 [Catellatospora sp. TT07R-123]|uniref:hypothetical protein n=1 Tax=Catellatospora sp. TT07R-123 TaxID=2733863 RepID=UPI001B0914E7|nr:hypothetical protein [Catellatospora sp. TT07R-123]GHJ46625.1 hypothetical protein Cs7R123_39670 [Catellatospora sp. TT07R-123]
MEDREIASGASARATVPHRHRLAALCGAALAAALFTPVQATAGSGEARPAAQYAAQAPAPEQAPAPAGLHTTHNLPPELMARSLISTGMIGIGLAVGGIVIVAYRRRQW